MDEHKLKALAWVMVVVVAVVLACTSSCGDDSKTAVDNADDLLGRWKQAGLEVGDHVALDEHALGKADCKRGKVGGVETTICQYPSDKAASAAQAAGLKMVGKTTGAALPRGKVLLVVADRDKADADGKIINQLTKLFLGR